MGGYVSICTDDCSIHFIYYFAIATQRRSSSPTDEIIPVTLQNKYLLQTNSLHSL